MSQKITDPRFRARVKTAAIPERTWWPEIAGAILLVVAVLETTNLLA